jgi:hypothetical protein
MKENETAIEKEENGRIQTSNAMWGILIKVALVLLGQH